jgi:hypothetical protein
MSASNKNINKTEQPVVYVGLASQQRVLKKRTLYEI